MAQAANYAKVLIYFLLRSSMDTSLLAGFPSILPNVLLVSTPDLSDEIMHVLIVALSFTLVVIASLAYLRKRNRRYLFLSLAFIFLLLSQIVTMLEVVVYSNYLLIIPAIGLHLSHLFDLLMLLSFTLALIRDWPNTSRINHERTFGHGGV
ncbi:MAG: hypothetical protein ACYC7D_04680 [Nitrososphaerales archaeon]